jgi:hypothetical protein
MQGDPETSGPWVWVGIGIYSHFLCVLPKGRDAFQMQMGISWEKKCLFDLLQSVLHSYLGYLIYFESWENHMITLCSNPYPLETMVLDSQDRLCSLF